MLYLEGSEKCGTPIEAIQQLTPIINIVIFIIEKHGPFHTHTHTHKSIRTNKQEKQLCKIQDQYTKTKIKIQYQLYFYTLATKNL